MLSNFVISSSVNDPKNFKSFYQKFQNLLGRGKEPCTPSASDQNNNMMASCSSTSDDGYITPVSSVGDLMAMSPADYENQCEGDYTSDILTGNAFDSICDVTVQDVPKNDDMFMNSSSIDYLLRCAESHKSMPLIDRGKESLFIKFDPLYAGLKQTITDSSIADGSDPGYETGSTMSMYTEITATPKHSLSMGSMSMCAKEKPTQVVLPTVTDHSKLDTTMPTTTPVLMRSMSAILIPTRVKTEKLVSISDNTPPTHPHSPRRNKNKFQEADHLQALKNLLQEQDQDILHLRKENRDLKYSLQDQEQKYVRDMKKIQEDFIEKENKLSQQINEKLLNNKQMCIVMEEYEKTMSSLIAGQQKEKVHIQEMKHERDEALTHLCNMETSFNDLLVKYEKCKNIIMDIKEREKCYEEKIAEYETYMEKYEILYNDLKKLTADKLSEANATLANIQKNHDLEVTKLNAIIKRTEITISSLQDSLNQKNREVEELTTLCDQLMK